MGTSDASREVETTYNVQIVSSEVTVDFEEGEGSDLGWRPRGPLSYPTNDLGWRPRVVDTESNEWL
jgi:hypothetical protein